MELIERDWRVTGSDDTNKFLVIITGAIKNFFLRENVFIHRCIKDSKFIGTSFDY